MAARTNLTKVVSDPGAGKHYLFKDGQFVNEWSAKSVSDITIYVNGVSGSYTATIQNDNISIPAISLGAVSDTVIEFPEIPAAIMSDKDHLLMHFTDKSFVDHVGGGSSCAFGHTDLASFSGVRVVAAGLTSTSLFVASNSGKCFFSGAQAIGSHYTYTCAEEVFSDDVAGKHYVVVSTEESSETDPHKPFLAMAVENAASMAAFAISEIYMENID